MITFDEFKVTRLTRLHVRRVLQAWYVLKGKAFNKNLFNSNKDY